MSGVDLFGKFVERRLRRLGATPDVDRLCGGGGSAWQVKVAGTGSQATY
jgi:hypothetical protein